MGKKCKLFGKSCFKKICLQLDVNIPKRIKERNKEKYLCSIIAKRLNKKGLTMKQKQWLSELYIVSFYIDKIEYVNLNELKKKIQKQIDNMNFLTGLLLPNKDLSMVLYSIYNVYNATENFKENLMEIEKMKTESKKQENKKIDKKVIQYFRYIFKVNKILNPKEYALGYYRQYIFWNAVISGGLIFNYKLAAKLLKHSLSEIGEKPKTYYVTDKSIIEDIKKDKDFTDFVFPEEYNDKYNEISKDENKNLGQKAVSSAKNGFGYTLNNIALISVQYGVLKEYDVKINFDIKNYGKEGD